MPDSIANTSDLADLPGSPLTGMSEVVQQKALDRATSWIIATIGWDPRQSVRVLTVQAATGYYGRPLVLPALNVTSVAVVSSGATLVDVTEYRWDARGFVYLDRALGVGDTVTYTAGWPLTTMPRLLVDACVDLAVNELTNPTGLTSWTVDDASETYEAGRGDPAQDPRLGAYRLVPVS